MTEIAISKERRRMIQKADKYVRKKEYACMIPGCGRKAVKCHAIPRASLVEALAENGSLYTLNQSFTTLFQHLTPSHPLEIVKVGVNQASVFKGLCSSHDCTVFAPLERPEESEKEEIFKPLHLRSLLLEHSRKRKSFDFFDKLDHLIRDEGIIYPFDEIQSANKLRVNLVELAIYGFVEEVPELGSGNIDYYCMVFSKNMNVSCCGVFNHLNDPNPRSMIAYNLISHADFSVLALTTFANEHHTLDSFLSSYEFPHGMERLLNEIAFFKGEEPLISPRLWKSLDENTKIKIKKSLVHPAWREIDTPPTIIKLREEDIMGTSKNPYPQS